MTFFNIVPAFLMEVSDIFGSTAEKFCIISVIPPCLVKCEILFLLPTISLPYAETDRKTLTDFW